MYRIPSKIEEKTGYQLWEEREEACGTSDQARAAVTEQGIGPDTDGVFFM